MQHVSLKSKSFFSHFTTEFMGDPNKMDSGIEQAFWLGRSVVLLLSGVGLVYMLARAYASYDAERSRLPCVEDLAVAGGGSLQAKEIGTLKKPSLEKSVVQTIIPSDAASGQQELKESLRVFFGEKSLNLSWTEEEKEFLGTRSPVLKRLFSADAQLGKDRKGPKELELFTEDQVEVFPFFSQALRLNIWETQDINQLLTCFELADFLQVDTTRLITRISRKFATEEVIEELDRRVGQMPFYQPLLESCLSEYLHVQSPVVSASWASPRTSFQRGLSLLQRLQTTSIHVKWSVLLHENFSDLIQACEVLKKNPRLEIQPKEDSSIIVQASQKEEVFAFYENCPRVFQSSLRSGILSFVKLQAERAAKGEVSKELVGLMDEFIGKDAFFRDVKQLYLQTVLSSYKGERKLPFFLSALGNLEGACWDVHPELSMSTLRDVLESEKELAAKIRLNLKRLPATPHEVREFGGHAFLRNGDVGVDSREGFSYDVFARVLFYAKNYAFHPKCEEVFSFCFRQAFTSLATKERLERFKRFLADLSGEVTTSHSIHWRPGKESVQLLARVASAKQASPKGAVTKKDLLEAISLYLRKMPKETIIFSEREIAKEHLHKLFQDNKMEALFCRVRFVV